MIEIKNLSGGGGAYAPVRNLQCKLNNGGAVAVLGEKGAGKSTLLALLSGALLPRTGTVKLNGLDLSRETARAKALVGFLPRGYEPDGTQTPVEYLLFAAEMRGMVYERALRRAQELLELIGLIKKRDVLIAKLTPGECRLLAVAQACMASPAFLFLDAPFAGLGARDAARLREWIAQMGESATVLVSARALGDLDRICTRAMILKDGALVDVCEVEGNTFAAACEAALAKDAPSEAEPTAEPAKKKSRWRLLTDAPTEYEVIDTDEREEKR